MTSSRPSARALAYQILDRTEAAQSYANLTLNAYLNRSSLPPLEKKLCTRLVYGVIEKKICLDWRISKLASRPIESLDAECRILLRLGLYQLLFMDKIPAHAAVNETVALASKKKKGLINAILRSQMRLADKADEWLAREDPMTRLSVRTNLPVPLLELLQKTYRDEELLDMARAFDEDPGLTLRIQTEKADPASYLEQLKNAGLKAEPCPHSSCGIKVEQTNPAALPGFEDGYFFVQDEASQLCVEAVGAKRGMYVIDTCACPGSKSFGMALCMENTGTVLSMDLHENKLSLVKDGALRLGLNCLQIRAHDGRKPDPTLKGCADRVLCDVPCSGFGILSKKPEIRHKDVKECGNLPSIQLQILEAGATYVKPGGSLVYSTCTILPRENQEVVEAFLKRHSDFSPEPFTVGGLSSDERGMLQLLPHIHHTDGFFLAKLTRTI